MKYILTIILLFNFNAYSSTNNSILNITEKYNLNKFNVKYTISQSEITETKFSKNCEIGYNQEKGFIDFEFSILHEFGHCLLGKNFFYNDIDWKIKVSENDKYKINRYIKENEITYLKDKKNTKLLKVVYHEIYADIFASLMYIKYNTNANNIRLNKIIKYRKKHNYSNPLETHLSSEGLNKVMNLSKKSIKNLTNEKIQLKSVIITQESFLNYIKNEYN